MSMGYLPFRAWLLVSVLALPAVAHAQAGGVPKASATVPGVAILGATGGAALAISNYAAGTNYADKLVDFLNDSVLGAAGATTNTSLYAADGQHLTNTGYAIAVANAAKAVNQLWH